MTQSRLCHNTRLPNVPMLQMPGTGGSGGPAAAGAGGRPSRSPGGTTAFRAASPALPGPPRRPGRRRPFPAGRPSSRSSQRGEAPAGASAAPRRGRAPLRSPAARLRAFRPRAGAVGSDGGGRAWYLTRSFSARRSSESLCST